MIENTKRIQPEKREQIWRILRAQNPKIVQQKSDRFFDELAQALNTFDAESRATTTYRDSSEALRDLFKLIEKPQTPIDKIRSKFKLLPQLARDDVLRRALWRFPDIFKDHEQSWARLSAWADTCSEHELIEIVQLLIATGRAWSEGQTRENGKTSAPHIEPLVLGRFRRFHPIKNPDKNVNDNDSKDLPPQPEPKSGHPGYAAIDDLLRHFGLIWLEATESSPQRLKGHKTPFVEAAEIVLELADIKNPEPHIRRLFSSIKSAENPDSQVPWDE